MGSLFGSSTPKAQPVNTMPDDQDQAVKDAQRRAAAAAQQRSGRTSTILTTPQSRAATSTSGTTSYGNSLLGQSN